ncbi:MAG: type II secretion system F family protein [Gammaproteobacteria bacterium]|nr:type II secretion system F family protein [Gammaproteobacteria bacterium]
MQFEIKGLLADGKIAVINLEAASQAEARTRAEADGYTVLRVSSARFQWGPLWHRKASFSLPLFSQELLALLRAGLSLIEAMEALNEKEQRSEVQQVIGTVLAYLQEGLTLSVALERLPSVFPPLYVASVRASEKTGNLTEALERYIAYYAQLDTIKKKIVNASIYPVLLLMVGGLVIVFLLGYVVPKFSAIYADSGQDLPWMSQLLVDWGLLLTEHGVMLLTVLALGLGAVGYGLSQASVRKRLIDIAWRLPNIGERLRVYQLARFYRALGMLLSSGIPIVPAVTMVAGLLPPELRVKLEHALLKIEQGTAISRALEAHELTTPIAARMLRVGERTGNMGEMMERIALFYDDEMGRWVDWFTRMFEPVLMTVIGLVIGIIVILMYLPIFELASSIQ